MIAGTSVGAAMVAMPITTAKFGTVPTIILILVSWLAMIFASLYMLEANLRHDRGANLITMAQSSLGRPGYFLCVSIYLMLLYCLNAAYLSELSRSVFDLFSLFFDSFSVSLSVVVVTALLICLFVLSSNMVGYLTQALMIGLILSYGVIAVVLTPTMDLINVQPTHWGEIGVAFPIIILAFGYQIIIPSLRRFLDDDVSALKTSIYIGSFVPVIIYVFWMLLVMLNLPTEGPLALDTIAKSTSLVDKLPGHLMKITGSHLIIPSCYFFVLFAIATSMIGASISLFDFVDDWLQSWRLSKFNLAVISILPPMLIVLFYPKVFILALKPAGALVGLLLMILPALMCLAARYQNAPSPYQVGGGIWPAMFVMLLAIIMIFLDAAHLLLSS